jgi:pimeloyl-ACP methyl ester carboxylesterase
MEIQIVSKEELLPLIWKPNEKFLDHFGIKKFVVIGWSGGGPHSLNMTRDSRCVAAFTLAGVGEWGKSDLNFLEGMGLENHDEFGEALKGEAAISNWMDANAPAMQSVSGEDLISALGGLIGDADKRALSKEVAEDMACNI